MFDEFLRDRAAGHRRLRSCRSTRPTTTTGTSTAGRGPTASAPSSPPAASPCRRAGRTTRPARETVNGLGNRKNEVLLGVIRSEGVEAVRGSVRYLRAAQRGRAAPGGRVGQRQLPRRARRGRARRPARGPGRRDRRRERAAARQAGAGHVPGRRRRLGVEPAQAAVFEDARGRRARPAGPAGSASWSGSTGSATPTTCGAGAERPSWSKI